MRLWPRKQQTAIEQAEQELQRTYAETVQAARLVGRLEQLVGRLENVVDRVDPEEGLGGGRVHAGG